MCGHKGPHYHYDFHHRDEAQKKFGLANVANKSWDIIRAELDKCDLLCVLCHRDIHLKNEDELFWKEFASYAGDDAELKELIENFGPVAEIE